MMIIDHVLFTFEFLILQYMNGEQSNVVKTGNGIRADQSKNRIRGAGDFSLLLLLLYQIKPSWCGQAKIYLLFLNSMGTYQ